ncbi:glycosyl hydrolase 115 family protein [Sphingomonas sp.]|uniref:glycosyl hydrolase 115 family protein n=1 Tax=Sphingomonas sp. TaxID=28214 RepID=UPI002FDAFA20
MRYLALLALLALPAGAHAQQVVLSDGRTSIPILHDDAPSAKLASELLARDIGKRTGRTPVVAGDLAACGKRCVVIGQKDSALVRQIAADAKVDLAALDGQWERYIRVLARSGQHPGRSYLLIAGSDARGAIWGTVDLSRAIGISAWEWWADVTPRPADRLAVDGGRLLSEAPSVQYRGIFLNDEDWGLQPWAANTYEPETGDIGPKTYARVFELLWRLKANMIWPAMHESTKPFYQIPGNAETAKAYAIVVGTSHAEPMMRNNVREWDERATGPFNFFTNRDRLVDYWRRRVDEVKGYENVYTIGLRGKHDSALEGAKSPEQALAATSQAIDVQRGLLATAQGKPADQVPQVLTLYKEVLDIYRNGLKVPEDVTLVWPEDNYGYLSQLPTSAERARKGGSGLYYHISYWGRPHDYLWLATTHPGLIREQLDRAWQTGTRKLWVVNVGDIKPGEVLTSTFLDIAFDAKLLNKPVRAQLADWAKAQFGDQGPAITDVLMDYYALAWERKPEFMGFSTVEPETPIRLSDYVRTGGGEAQARIARYKALLDKAEALGAAMPADRRDAFFQLVLYPVRGAAKLNERNLKLDLAALYARQGRASANALADQARAAHQTIVADTAAYNAQNGGKWRGIMNMAPRRLAVFAEPSYPRFDLPAVAPCGVDAPALAFVRGRAETRFMTVYGRGAVSDWTIEGLAGVELSARSGRLDASNGYEMRVAVTYDGKGAIAAGKVRCPGTMVSLVPVLQPFPVGDSTPEVNHIISLTPANLKLADTPWERIDELGSRGAVLRSKLDLPSTDEAGAAAPLILPFQLDNQRDAELKIVALPVHALTSANKLRIGVRVDGGAITVLDYETHGRSDEWKANVLSNSAVRTLKLGQLAAGAHRIDVFAMDPGFLLDRIDVRLDGAPDYYGAPPIR